MATAALVPMAAIYPAARRSTADRSVVAREVASVVVMAGLASVALRSPTRGRRLAAAGWLGHAVFDLVHDPGRGSRLPSWYRPLCAGFDVAYGVALLDGRVPRTG